MQPDVYKKKEHFAQPTVAFRQFLAQFFEDCSPVLGTNYSEFDRLVPNGTAVPKGLIKEHRHSFQRKKYIYNTSMGSARLAIYLVRRIYREGVLIAIRRT